MSREQEKRRNREMMPETAKRIDAWRAAFGPRTRFPWLQEGSEVRGKETPPQRAMNADQWLLYVRTGVSPEGVDR